jgi:hypothetical protein
VLYSSLEIRAISCLDGVLQCHLAYSFVLHCGGLKRYHVCGGSICANERCKLTEQLTKIPWNCDIRLRDILLYHVSYPQRVSMVYVLETPVLVQKVTTKLQCLRIRYTRTVPIGFGSLQLFQKYITHDAVLEAHIAMNIQSLEAKIEKRTALVQKIEHITALERIRGKTKHHHKVSFSGRIRFDKVDSMSTYLQHLETLSRDIAREVAEVMRQNDSYQRNLIRTKNHPNIKECLETVKEVADTPDSKTNRHGVRGRFTSHEFFAAGGSSEFSPRKRRGSTTDELDDEMMRILSPTHEYQTVEEVCIRFDVSNIVESDPDSVTEVNAMSHGLAEVSDKAQPETSSSDNNQHEEALSSFLN